MLGNIAKLLLVSTSFAPVLVTLAFVSYINDTCSKEWVYYLAAALGLVLITLKIIDEARNRLETLPICIKALKNVDREILSFLIVYLFPLLSQSAAGVINWKIVGFLLAMFFFVVWGTHSYHFNPLLGLFGYHFYEVTTEGGVTYVLITRRSLKNTKGVERVVQLGEHVVLDREKEK